VTGTIYARPGLSHIVEGACINCLQISKKFFSVPMGMSKRKIRYWGFVYLLLMTVLLWMQSIFIIDAEYNHYICNNGFLDKCDKKENLELNGGATASCLKRTSWNSLSNVTYSPNHRQFSAPVINIQSTLRTASDLCKPFHTQYDLVVTVIHIQSLRSQICVFTHTVFTVWKSRLGKRNTNLGEQWMPLAKEIFQCAILDMRAISSPGLC
jgi:hypothetical protein